MYLTCNSMNNKSSYWGLVDAKIRASDKNLPVIHICKLKFQWNYLESIRKNVSWL